MAFSLQARIVFPVDRPSIEHGVVTMEGERIMALGGAETAVGKAYDLGDVVILPGLVNTHTHLEFSDLKRPLGQAGMRLVDWIRLVIAERNRRTDCPIDSIAAGLLESVTAGVTTIAEIATADAVSYTLGKPVELMLLAEVIGFSRARAAAAITAVTERLDALQRRNDSDPGGLPRNTWQLGISPHAPYTVSPELLRQLVELARRRNLPVAMHLAESAEEIELLAAGTGEFQELLDERSMWDAAAIHGGSRPLDYLRLLAEAPRALVIHGNYLEADESDFLAARAERMSLVVCPRTHAYFGHPPYPLADMLAAGVRVALGTDSRASNPDLNLLAEMRHVARIHPTIDPHAIVRMGTLAGAEALGLDWRVGSLTAGKLANAIAVPLPPGATGSPQEMLAAVLANADRPSAVWLRGREVVSPP